MSRRIILLLLTCKLRSLRSSGYRVGTVIYFLTDFQTIYIKRFFLIWDIMEEEKKNLSFRTVQSPSSLQCLLQIAFLLPKVTDGTNGSHFHENRHGSPRTE